MSLRCRLGYHAWEFGTRNGSRPNFFGDIEINLRICTRCMARDEMRLKEGAMFKEWLRVPLDEQQASRVE